MNDLFTTSFDDFSPDRRYRYVMGRIWDASIPKLVSCALNPSIGDMDRNDPTNERLQRRAYRLSLGGVIFVNIFPYVATDPADLKKTANPFGDRARADDTILNFARGNFVICGWGVNGSHLGRGAEVDSMLRRNKIRLYVLGFNADGSPKHPLFTSYAAEPIEWLAAGEGRS